MKFAIKTLSDKFFCSELNLKQYKELLKCSFGDDPDREIFLETVCDIIGELLKKPANSIKKLSIIDAILIILQLKINSHGDAIKLVVTKNSSQMNLELDLNYVNNKLIEFYSSNSLHKIIDNDIELYFACPSIERLLDSIEDEYLYFLDKVVIKNKEFKVLTNSEAANIFNKLPPKFALQFIEHFRLFVSLCSNSDCLQRYNVDQTFTVLPSLESLIWCTKLLFSEPLDVFYDNLFYLSHLGHLNLSYVDTLSPGEYFYMVKKLEQTLKANSPDNNSEQDIQDVSDENFDDSGMFDQ